MKTLPESPLLLPIKTRIYIEKKNAYIDHIMLSPTDSTDKLFDLLKNYFNNLNDEITDYADSGFYITRSNYESDINSTMINRANDIKIEKGVKVISTGLMPNEILIFKGNYVLKSSAPKNCITYEFEKVKGTLLKYFSCEQCKLNCNIV
jgi:hypothetical protein